MFSKVCQVVVTAVLIVVTSIALAFAMVGCGGFITRYNDYDHNYYGDVSGFKSCPLNPYYPLIESAIKQDMPFYEYEKTERINALIRASHDWDKRNPCRCVDSG